MRSFSNKGDRGRAGNGLETLGRVSRATDRPYPPTIARSRSRGSLAEGDRAVEFEIVFHVRVACGRPGLDHARCVRCGPSRSTTGVPSGLTVSTGTAGLVVNDPVAQRGFRGPEVPTRLLGSSNWVPLTASERSSDRRHPEK